MLRIGAVEPVVLVSGKKRRKVLARIDTGARRTSIDVSISKKLELKKVGEREVKSANGIEVRPVVEVVFYLAGKRISTRATAAQRGHMTYPMLVGRQDLKGFVVDPAEEKLTQPL